MKISALKILVTFSICMMLANCQNSQKALGELVDREAVYGDWSVYRINTAHRPNCWIATTPISRPSRFSEEQIYISIKEEKKEFSITAEQKPFKYSFGKLFANNQAFLMIFVGKNGWLENSAVDNAAFNSLSTSSSGKIEVGSDIFVFSTRGLNEAFSAAEELCRRP